MGTFDIMSGVGITSAPLINLDTIIDEDMSLLSYIVQEVPNEKVFDFSVLDKFPTVPDIVAELYHAEYDNPLYLLMRNKSDKEFLDECYKEFMSDPSFLANYAISTDLFEMIDNFISSGEILTTIIYKNDYEKNLIENNELLSKATAKHISEIDIDYYTQIFLNRITDAERYTKKAFKRTFYFSSRGSNLNSEKTELVDKNDILKDISARNSISVFDMYREDRIGRSIY